MSGDEGQLENQGTDGKTKCSMPPPSCSVRKTGVLRQGTRVMGGDGRGGGEAMARKRTEESYEEAKWLFFSLPNSNQLTLHKIDSQIDR